MKTPKSPASPPKPCSACNAEEKTGFTTKAPRRREDEIQEKCKRLSLEKTGLKTTASTERVPTENEIKPDLPTAKIRFRIHPHEKTDQREEVGQSILPVFSVLLGYLPHLLFNLFLFDLI
jgi:hypothetical protein